ncbi:ribosome silencing factor [Sandaracinus amylolyticus]|uniref:ribosome silencing factor n=1 Tax=Sandaracinus amylolyticus TaxID=927083 RepID=UPI001F0240D9|nr:ribosome silencing factor [Sandaracinus amylolyticus]UJR80729.1 Ribosomal silencing factor RsfS [Sandaracinus amylolyticus]
MATARKKTGNGTSGTKKTATKKAATKKTTTKKAASKPAASAAPKTRTTRTKAVAKTAPTANEVARTVALAVAEAALDKKAVNVEIIDVAGKVDYADYVVVMSGTSDRQVNALARGIAEDVEQKTKNKCLGVEGLPGGAWVLMDFGDVVVHIFHHDVRGYYDLESLWIDAARVTVPGPAPASRG